MLERRLSLRAEINEITRLNDWLDTAFAAAGLAPEVASDLKLCLNEAVANAILYAFAAQPDPRLKVVLTAGKGTATAVVIDNGSAFNPLTRPRRDKLTSIKDAVPGGFGIQLMRDTASIIRYERAGEENQLTIVCDGRREDSVPSEKDQTTTA